jgi:co-chaperonin GroES (HSP10)
MSVVTQMKPGVYDAKEDIVNATRGWVDDYHLFHNKVLVAVYERPTNTKSAGGIIIPDKNLEEDKFQGKVGLVLKVGPGAFVDDEHNKFFGMSVSPGDWVVFRPSDTWAAKIKGKLCRHLEDSNIVARIPSPDFVY